MKRLMFLTASLFDRNLPPEADASGTDPKADGQAAIEKGFARKLRKSD